MTDISRKACNDLASRLYHFGEYEMAQLEGYSLWPFADMILALRAALDAAEEKLATVLLRESETTRRYDERLDAAEAERVTEWNRRRDAQASRDVARAACDAMRMERDAADRAGWERARGEAESAANKVREENDDFGFEDMAAGAFEVSEALAALTYTPPKEGEA